MKEKVCGWKRVVGVMEEEWGNLCLSCKNRLLDNQLLARGIQCADNSLASDNLKFFLGFLDQCLDFFRIGLAGMLVECVP